MKFSTVHRIFTLRCELGDFEMADFEAHGKTYKNSFVTYENFYQNHEDAEVREKSFRSFSEGLRKHQNTAAAAI